MKRFVASLYRNACAGILFFLLAPLVLSGCGEGENPVMSEQHATSEGDYQSLEFPQPITFEQLADLSERENLKVEEIRLEFEEFTSGYTVGGRELRALEGDFYTQHEAFLRVMAEAPKSIADSVTEKSSLFSRLLQESEERDAFITTVTFQGPVREELISELRAKRRDDVVVSPPHPSESAKSLAGADTLIARAPQSYGHERWAPYGGTSEIPRHFTRQYFVFNNVQDFAGGDRTYEHETRVLDRNFADFAGYWASSLPNPYKDTQFLDNIDNFTIGTFRADYLQTGVWYWTYMSLSPQSSSTSLCYITGQIGHRSPSWCYSTWCVWADGTTTYPPGMAYLRLPNYGVSWQY